MGNVMFANRLPPMLKAYRDKRVADQMDRLRTGNLEDQVLASYAPHQLVEHIEECFDVDNLNRIVNPEPVKECDLVKWQTVIEDEDVHCAEISEMVRMPSKLTGFYVHPRYIFSSFKELRDTLVALNCPVEGLFFYFMGRGVWTFPAMLLSNAEPNPITVQVFAYKKTYPVFVISQGTQGINSYSEHFVASFDKASDMEFDGKYQPMIKDWWEDRWQLIEHETLQWSNM